MHGVSHDRRDRVERVIRWAGLGELDRDEIWRRYSALKYRMLLGLAREGPPTTADGGLLAVRTKVLAVSDGDWDRAPAGATALVASIAGTNWDYQVATKQADGGIRLAPSCVASYPEDQRRVPLGTFLDRIADTLAETYQDVGGTPCGVGISLGFPNTVTQSEFGPDAELAWDLGHLPKQWRITDWATAPAEDRKIGSALGRRLRELGVRTRRVSVINDTPAVALDRAAIQAARSLGLEVLPLGVVGGTGTNIAVNHGGLVNLELGHAPWPDDPIYERMRRNGWVEGSPELEFETGMYLSYRLAAGMQLLGEQLGIREADSLAADVVAGSQRDQAFLSTLATGGGGASFPEAGLAARVLTRAGQVYGAAIAAAADVCAGANSNARPRGALVEGSVIFKGRGVREAAQRTAALLGQPVTLLEASGLRGVASLVMSLPPTSDGSTGRFPSM